MGHNDNRDTLVTLARGLFTSDAEEIVTHRTPIEIHIATRTCFCLVVFGRKNIYNKKPLKELQRSGELFM